MWVHANTSINALHYAYRHVGDPLIRRLMLLQAAAVFLDPPAMVCALTGIETVFFVSAFETEDRLLHHNATADAFFEAGVKRVV